MNILASPPKFLSFEQLMEAASGVKNMALAHEIAVNSDFKLESFQPPDDRYLMEHSAGSSNKQQKQGIRFLMSNSILVHVS